MRFWIKTASGASFAQYNGRASHRCRCLAVWLLMFLLPLPMSVQAETMYVDDNLRVGVRPVPDSRQGPINVVTTGMKLEVLDRRDGFLQIRTESGIEGWIKENYASKDKPAVIRLDVLNEEHQKLVKQFEEVSRKASEASEANQALIADLKKLKQENIDLHLQLVKEEDIGVHPSGNSGRVWLIIAGVFLAVLLFAAGAAWYRYSMSRRFGGLRF